MTYAELEQWQQSRQKANLALMAKLIKHEAVQSILVTAQNEN